MFPGGPHFTTRALREFQNAEFHGFLEEEEESEEESGEEDLNFGAPKMQSEQCISGRVFMALEPINAGIGP